MTVLIKFYVRLIYHFTEKMSAYYITQQSVFYHQGAAYVMDYLNTCTSAAVKENSTYTELHDLFDSVKSLVE